MSREIINRLVVKPQLARKRQTIKIPQRSTTKLVIQPKPIISTTKPTAKPKPTTPEQIKQTPIVVINRPRALRKKEPRQNKGVTYVTPDNTRYDQEKIKNIRGKGIGKILAIIGNGPSISEVPLELLRGNPYIDIMSINKPDDRVWPTTYWAFFDQSQMRRHQHLWDNYNGIIFNSTSIKQSKSTSIKFKNNSGYGFSLDLMRGFYIGRSSVYAAMQIGLWLDYNKIYIFGCDMCEVDGKVHFYGVNPDVQPSVRVERFAKEAEYYDDAANKLNEEIRNKFTFCTSYNKYGFVEKFNKVDHSESIAKLLSYARTLYK